MTNTTGTAQQRDQPTQLTLAGVLSREQAERILDLANAYATAEADYSEALWRSDATLEEKRRTRLAGREAHAALLSYVYGEVTP